MWGYLLHDLRLSDHTGGFSFLDFYTRRIRRLLPAAYTMFFATVLVSAVLLNGVELKDFGKQLLGALTFSANFVLWQQYGYFDGAAQVKPLPLRVWSLAIEEQYLPAPTSFARLRSETKSAAGAWTILFSSLVLCLFFGPRDPAATFTLVPARAWELAIGSVGSLTLERVSGESFRFRDEN